MHLIYPIYDEIYFTAFDLFSPAIRLAEKCGVYCLQLCPAGQRREPQLIKRICRAYMERQAARL